jgi:hypothetical protein
MKNIIYCLIGLAFVFSSCEKEVGEGGTATIKGKVFGYDINNSGIVLDSAFVGDYRVYLSYGDNEWADKDERTSYTGDYAFRGLQKGRYKVFVFSKCVTCAFEQTVLVQYAEVTKNGETIVMPLFKIKD